MTQGIDALPVQAAKDRLLITLVMDTSESMGISNRITELNAALQQWRQELIGNDYIRRHGEIAIVTFGNGGVRTVDPTGRNQVPVTNAYVSVSQFNPPAFQAGGVTPMIHGIQQAFDLLAARKRQLRQDGRPLAHRPLVYMITDGVPTDANGHASDDWQRFAGAIRQQENGRHLLFFAFGVDGAQQEVLSGLAPKSWRFLANTRFSDVLKMVSTSIESVAAADADDLASDAIYDEVGKRLDRYERMQQWMRDNG
jgi:uncharacterized protein YegL